MNIVEVVLAFFVGIMFLILFCFVFNVSFGLFQKLLLNVLFGVIIYVIFSAIGITSLNIIGGVLTGAGGSFGVILLIILHLML